ncbi:hypothetical protein LDENG_00273110 [Lucifuga dentata]|nr:hypothetical protein LDENG_00273110 [Lucifuga dentata]
MQTTTYDYDYGTEDYADGPVQPCNRDGDNSLGARLSPLYYLMFLFSLFGNGLVLVIIHRFEKLTTVTNIFLLNLVASCLVFMCSLPFWGIYQQLGNWIFGTVLCKIVGSMCFLGFYSSVLFLTLLTFDRHLAVVYSLAASRVRRRSYAVRHLAVVYSLAASRVRRRSYAVASCVGVWLISILACIKPMTLYTTFTYLDNVTYCEELLGDSLNDRIDVAMLRSAGFYIQLFLFFLFPLAVIVYCYVRITITVLLSKIVSKFQTVRLIFVIMLLFFACGTPYNIILLMHDEAATCEEMRRMGYALHITRNVAYIYFCICPIFYTFVGKKFQNHFRQLLAKRFPKLKTYVSVSQTSRANTKTTPIQM